MGSRCRPASDPHSPVNHANLVVMCGKCHAGANVSFVQYQPHANARVRKLNPALYFVRLFMNLLLIGVLDVLRDPHRVVANPFPLRPE